jgi:hypothetical protein
MLFEVRVSTEMDFWNSAEVGFFRNKFIITRNSL